MAIRDRITFPYSATNHLCHYIVRNIDLVLALGTFRKFTVAPRTSPVGRNLNLCEALYETWILSGFSYSGSADVDNSV